MNWHGWVDVATVVSGAATAFGALAAVAALIVYICQLRHQSVTRDFSALMEFQREAGALWERLHASPELRSFHLGQLLVFYEAMCRLHNKNVFSKRVEDLIRDHIIEVFIAFYRDPQWRADIEKMVSGRNTFTETVRFLSRHRREYVEHWDWLIKAGHRGQSLGPDGPSA